MINLLPPELKESVRYGRLNVIMLKYALVALSVSALVFILMMVGGTLISQSQGEIKASIEADRARVNELRTAYAEAQKIAGVVDTIDSVLDREVQFSELLQEIGSIMPSGAALTNLSISEDRSEPINLLAAAQSEETIAVLRENLADSKLFEAADVISIASISNSQYTVSASITAIFTPSQNNELPQLDVDLEPEPVVESEGES